MPGPGPRVETHTGPGTVIVQLHRFEIIVGHDALRQVGPDARNDVAHGQLLLSVSCVAPPPFRRKAAIRSTDLKLSISTCSSVLLTPNSFSRCSTSSTNPRESSTPVSNRSVSGDGISR